MLLCAGARDMDRRKDMGLPGSAFPLDLPSPGLMPIPDVSQPPQPMTGAAGTDSIAPVSHLYSGMHSVVRDETKPKHPWNGEGRIIPRHQDGSQIRRGKHAGGAL